MQLAETMLRLIDNFSAKISSLVFLITISVIASAQDNSPYSRYGLGNEFPKTNVINHSMGGVAVADSDAFSINYANPASYGNFQTIIEQRSKKVAAARVILDVGINFDNRSLTTPNTPQSFASSDALFSHVFIGLPIKKNWGLVFGIRPLSRISYNISRTERLVDPSTNLPIDSATTQFTGSGGSFLPTIGTGFGTDNLKVGVSVGYLFGKKEVSAHRVFLNDTVDYAPADFTTNTFFGGLYFNVGAQYKINLGTTSALRLGFSGSWKQTLHASQDVLRQTYSRDAGGGEVRVDSVFEQSGIAGQVIYPATYTVGAIYLKKAESNRRGYSVGVDFTQNQWDQFRFFGAKDSVQTNSIIQVGGQLNAVDKPVRYGQTISYRFGFYAGKDYIHVQNNMPVYGVTLGMGLPIVNYNRVSQLTQYSILNIGLEYARRGNNNNPIKENLFRVSVGFNFTDLWFAKRKYD